MNIRVTLFGILLLQLVPHSSWADSKIVYPDLPPAAALNQGIPLSAYALHPADSEYHLQAWNTYFRSDDGYHVFVNFMVSNVGVGDNACGLNIAITSPSGESHIQTQQFKGKDFKGETGSLNITCREMLLSATKDTLHLKGEYSELGVDLNVTRQGPGLGLTQFNIDDSPDKFVQYNVPHIASLTKGRIKWKGKWLPVKGKVILSYLNQSVGFHHYSLQWDRVRFMDDDTTLLIGGFKAAPGYGEGYTLFILAKKGTILHATNQVKLTPIKTTLHPASGYALPEGFNIQVKDSRIDLSGTIAYQHQMAQFDVLGKVNWILGAIIRALVSNPWIFRNETTLQLEYTLDGQPKERINERGVHEVTFIND